MDRTRLESLYRRFGSVVHRRARAVLRNDADARDAMQDVFLKALSGCPEDDDAALKWFYRVTTNVCIGMLRKRKVRSEAAPQLTATEGTGGEAREVDRATAAALLARFDARTQAVVVHYYVDGMSQDEVADMTGLSRKTVGKRLARFRDESRKILEG